MKTIYEFKKGDEIVRVVPAKAIITGAGRKIRDRSYLGERMIFAGIANGQVYLQRTDDLHKQLFGDRLRGIPLDLWDEGWDNWIDPETLLDNIIPTEQLMDKLEAAKEEENYELCAKLTKLLNKK